MPGLAYRNITGTEQGCVHLIEVFRCAGMRIVGDAGLQPHASVLPALAIFGLELLAAKSRKHSFDGRVLRIVEVDIVRNSDEVSERLFVPDIGREQSRFVAHRRIGV